jgi:cytochrome P450
MVAGTETVATFLSGVTFNLLSRPSTMKLLTGELRNTFSSAKDIDSNALVRLPYLNACIEEGLRIYPPVPTGLPRIVGKGGAKVCGYDLPEKVNQRRIVQSISYHEESTD